MDSWLKSFLWIAETICIMLIDVINDLLKIIPNDDDS